MNAISVQRLGKKFKLFPSPGKRFIEYLSAGKLIRHTDFWALQDITFEIPAGTTLGILGQNGSGKSTLLSILAGVLEPTTGSFTINGKVSAILELGSGFHPDFSGRDNVYMYGSIVGLSKEEIDSRFDEIVRFSELGDFIDQPLRTYSSGMVVRLAFSVAVNVNADILIVDEALAVGDAIFQHRCFRKIREMQESGKTILYVGHDTEAVRNLCTDALLLDGGRIIERGDPNIVVNKYNALIAERERTYSESDQIEHGEIPGDDFETLYDFIQHISEAQTEYIREVPIQVQKVEIQSVPRRIIFAHPPSKIKYSFPVEPGACLSFAVGILPAAWEKIPQGVKFDIEVESEGISEKIFSRVLQPKRNIGDRGWHNFLIPLDKYSLKTVDMIFNTSGFGDDLSYCWSAWGWGKIIQISKKKYSDLITLNTETDSWANVVMADPLKNVPEIRYGNKKAEIQKVELLDKEGLPKFSFKSGEPITIHYKMVSRQDFVDAVTIGFIIRNKFTEIYGTNTHWKNCDLYNVKKGEMSSVKINFPLSLGSGTYSLTSAIAIIHTSSDVEVLDRIEDHLIFQVKNDQNMTGIVDLNAKFSIDKNNSGH